MTADVMFATGLLRAFSDAGVFEAADVHVAQRLTALTGESDERVALAVALVVRALRGGSVCVDLRAASGLLGDADLPWPGADDWLAAVRASALLGPPPVLRFFGDLLYFDRYWLEEEQVCTDLLALSAPPVGIESSSYERLFEPGYEEQRAAAEIAVSQAVTVLTGGPGTGKTTTIARLLALLLEHAERAGMPPPRIALAAPTGKAAARLAEAVAAGAQRLGAADRARLAGLSGTTLHRLLGPRPDTSVRFKHNRANRLPHDVIVVDETSMVSLTMMARLAEAVRPDSRLILVGDPDQLASVEAGAVLADLVDGLSARGDVRVAALRTPHRYGTSIGALAEAIRVGDADRVVELLAAGGEHVEWVDAQRPADRLR
ncbi:AAA family ATPase, partial [Mycobacterium intracellulare]